MIHKPGHGNYSPLARQWAQPLTHYRCGVPIKTRRFALLIICLAILLAGNHAVGFVRQGSSSGAMHLTGQFLVASQRMQEPTFARTVIYILAHDDRGAMGLVVNRTLGKVPLRELLAAVGVKSRNATPTDLYSGGPVEPARGFVLHSSDYSGASTQILSKTLSLSVGVDVMKAVAVRHGPKRLIFLLGYTGWAPGQLESEIARNDWLLAPADESLIFSEHPEQVWQNALKHAGMPL